MEAKRIRVLVVDDSTVVLRILIEILGADDRIEVVGTAVNGKIALEKIEDLRPDVITLDLEMPVMGGLETLAELRRRFSEVPVIVFSAPNEAGAVGVLAALHGGASDYVTKPSQIARIADVVDALQAELIPKICALHASAQRSAKARDAAGPDFELPVVTPSSQPLRSLPPLHAAAPTVIPEIVVIGTSTGGPRALQAILPNLPASFPVPILVVQHMPASFTSAFARSLDERCQLEVREAFEAAEARPGQVWIAPGDHHITVERTSAGCRLHLDQGPKQNSCRPAVDALFRSVARAFGPRTLALVLTGMGTDGTEGARALRQAGARIVIQDEQSSVVWGMPGSIASARLADQVLPQDEIAPFLERSLAARTPRR